jgi:signal transduction histidine kinase
MPYLVHKNYYIPHSTFFPYLPYIYSRKPIPISLNAFRRFIGSIPAWAFVLVLLAITVNTLYFIYKHQTGVDGQSNQRVNGKCLITYITPGGASEKAGMLPGDTLLTVDGIEVREWSNLYRGDKAGDTAIYGVIRNGQELGLPVVFTSPYLFFYGFTITMFVILILLSITSLYLVYKKPDDTAVKLFFIYLQAFAICQNATYLSFSDPLAIAASSIFWLCTCLIGPLLIHFHLLFPRTAKIYNRFKKLPLLFYLIGLIFFIVCLITYIPLVHGRYYLSDFGLIKRIALSWLTFTYLVAVAIVIYQFVTIKDTLSRNQLRLVIIGSFFGIYTGVFLVITPGLVYHISAGHPYFIPVVQGIGGLIMISLILVAIFRYRIWDIGVIFRKALLYLGATMIITLSYFLLILMVNNLTEGESDLTQFLALALSIILFLVLRDRLQSMIDRLFHRETYDTATVVASFEEKLAGIYRSDELKAKIVQNLDEIFHFKSLVFILKKNELIYEPAFVLGIDNQKIDNDFEVTREFEKMLRKSKVFSPGELDQKHAVLEVEGAELVVPLLKEDQPYGFFLCGPKKSEKNYSIQDIRVLSLIAKRVIALFHTANLYQKDLDRQLMLERERARISQDMHDDVGASLTRISILSDLAKNKDDITGETRQWLGQISDTSRGVMEEMSQIIWALNPKNDTLDGLVAYIRRFANEYLEPTTVNCAFDLPEELPEKALGVEVRRNIYLVVREVLHNVVKHAGATSVVLRFKIEDYRFKIEIKDNGKGFDPGNLEFPGNGMVNMKKRMNDIGGEFLIRSEFGVGTAIELVILM